MEASGESGHVKSILRAAELLDVLSSAEGPLSLGELSERLGWAKSTTHGIVSTLTAASLTEQRQSDGKYGLSVRAFELGCAARRVWNELDAQNHLQHLAIETDGSAFLAALDGTDTVLLETATVTGNFQILSPTGTRTPVHCSSHGKVLLAFRPENEREMLIRRLNLVKYTPATVRDADALRLACREIRGTGYCVENGEYRMGLCSVSAPVLDRTGAAKYAVGIVGLARDGDLSAVLRGTAPVLAAADALSRKLRQMK
ncbi:MAG: IclR family transcriptional regulator [Oscillospiraceae bacterium]|nr:IclR family transcriptional regulator [Oscillospiraceae bacterium]